MGAEAAGRENWKMAILREIVNSQKVSVFIHDTWSCRGLPLLSHFINFSPHNHLVVIYRNNQELCFLKRKIRKNVDFIQWKLNVNPPSIDEKKFIYLSNVWPGNDQISWWLNGIRQNFVAVIHDDISSSQISSMAPVNLYLKKSDRVQIISSKMKGKNNYGVESFLEENMKFI